MQSPCNYLLIGNGKVAKHFQYYFRLLNLPYLTWQRSESVMLLNEKMKSVTHVLLLISDQAIDTFISKYLLPTDAVLIHFSGSLISQYAHGLHPLMTFNQTLYSLKKYQSIYFIKEREAPLFSELLPGLPNSHYELDKADKAKYHAFCVLSGNFSCLLWQKLFAQLEEDFHIPRAVAFPYLRQQTENLIARAETALTGPLLRQDHTTIQDNLNALDNDPYQKVYQSFVSCYQSIKQDQDALPDTDVSGKAID